MQGNLFSNLPGGLICKLFLLQNVSLAFDELYLEKLQIVNNVQLGLTLNIKCGKTKSQNGVYSSRKKKMQQDFFTLGHLRRTQGFGHICHIPQNTFIKPRYQPRYQHEDKTCDLKIPPRPF